jgi:hypothetical protein
MVHFRRAEQLQQHRPDAVDGTAQHGRRNRRVAVRHGAQAGEIGAGEVRVVQHHLQHGGHQAQAQAHHRRRRGAERRQHQRRTGWRRTMVVQPAYGRFRPASRLPAWNSGSGSTLTSSGRSRRGDQQHRADRHRLAARARADADLAAARPGWPVPVPALGDFDEAGEVEACSPAVLMPKCCRSA